MTANADQITYWNEVAGSKWVDNQTKLDRLMAPLTEALIDAAAPTTGEHVLDVGCGCGDLSLRLASFLGSGGHIIAVDISRPMLAHAQARENDEPTKDVASIEWIRADAMTYAFEPETDLMVSRFGVMFFDDRQGAFRNLRSSLKPDGRFAFLTWRRCADVEWMQTPIDWLSEVLPRPAETTGEIGPFGLADADATLDLLGAAGFCDLTVDKVDRPLTIGKSADEAFDLLSTTGPAAAMLRDIGPADKPVALECLRKGLKTRAGDGGVVFGGACWLYRGRA